LEGSGNDFMSSVFIGDTAYAVWGDIRTGSVRIYLNKWNVNTHVGTSQLLTNNTPILLSPNPIHTTLQIPKEIVGSEIQILNLKGEMVWMASDKNQIEINVSALPMGTYLLAARKGSEVHHVRFVKE
jgi:hypothetical protein